MGRAILSMIMLILVIAVAGCSSPSEVQKQTGGDTAKNQLTIDLPGKKSLFSLDERGRLLSKIEVASSDGRIHFNLDKGATILDTDKKPVGVIQAVLDSAPPPPPEDAQPIGTVYRVTPQDAVANPWLRITLSYEPEKLPQGIGANDLYIAFHGGDSWQKLRYKSIDTNSNTISTQVQSLGRFAVMADKRLATSPTAPVTGIQVGNLAPDFSFDLETQSGTLSGLQGKPVILNFWATWCNPCRIEMPFLQAVYKENLDKGLAMLTVNLRESPDVVNRYMQSTNLSLPVVFDSKGDIAQKYRVSAIPVTYFIDKSGIIRAVKIGAFLSKAEIDNHIKKIMP